MYFGLFAIIKPVHNQLSIKYSRQPSIFKFFVADMKDNINYYSHNLFYRGIKCLRKLLILSKKLSVGFGLVIFYSIGSSTSYVFMSLREIHAQSLRKKSDHELKDSLSVCKVGF